MKELVSIEELEFSIGGYFATHHEVSIKGDTVSFISYIHFPDNEDRVEISLTKEQISAFISTLNEAGVLKWKKQYDDPGMLDGTQWNLKVKYNEGAAFKAYGSNAYPENIIDGVSEFKKLLKGLRKLIQQPRFFNQ